MKKILLPITVVITTILNAEYQVYEYGFTPDTITSYDAGIPVNDAQRLEALKKQLTSIENDIRKIEIGASGLSAEEADAELKRFTDLRQEVILQINDLAANVATGYNYDQPMESYLLPDLTNQTRD